MKTVILHTRKRTKSNSFSDVLFRTLTVAPSVSNETDKTHNCHVTINYVNKFLIVLQIVNF
jgi:hypothetical protein